MKKPYFKDAAADAAFLEYIAYLRKQPPHPGFPRKSFDEIAREQGIKPIDKAELLDIVTRYGLADGE